MIQIDDLWLASYLISQGAKLAGVSVLTYSTGLRLRAVFELENVHPDAIAAYSQGDPVAKVHQLRNAINQLRDLMYCELEKRNGSIKAMPNGQRRRRENENRSIRNR